MAIAAASPANEIALKVSPSASSTSAAAASETGIVTSATKAVRHWSTRAAVRSASSTAPMISASLMLLTRQSS
jgi:hypothetical protein